MFRDIFLELITLIRIAGVAVEETLKLLHPPVLLRFVLTPFFKYFFYLQVTYFQFSNNFSLKISLFSCFIQSINPTDKLYLILNSAAYLFYPFLPIYPIFFLFLLLNNFLIFSFQMSN